MAISKSQFAAGLVNYLVLSGEHLSKLSGSGKKSEIGAIEAAQHFSKKNNGKQYVYKLIRVVSANSDTAYPQLVEGGGEIPADVDQSDSAV